MVGILVARARECGSFSERMLSERIPGSELVGTGANRMV